MLLGTPYKKQRSHNHILYLKAQKTNKNALHANDISSLKGQPKIVTGHKQNESIQLSLLGQNAVNTKQK